MSAPAPRLPSADAVALAGAQVCLDPAGALVWPAMRLLAVADLHLEKGSAFAARGAFLPPYDTAATLARLTTVIARHDPAIVVALGDSFHDAGGAGRLAAGDRSALAALQRGRRWVWIAGNHDPAPPAGLAGEVAEALALGPLLFRHVPRTGAAPGEIAGHLHPVAKLRVQGRAVRRRCFATCGGRLVMPAFGAYAGGLNVLDPAFAPVFPAGFTALLLGPERLYAVPSAALWGD